MSQAKYNLTATHGVHLWDLGVKFERTEDRVDGEGRSHAVYAYSTDDPKVAAALLEVDGYGITTDDDTRKAVEAAAKKGKADAEAKAKAKAEADAKAKADADAKAEADTKAKA